MNKAELVIAIAEKTQMTKKDSEAALVAALEAITDALNQVHDSRVKFNKLVNPQAAANSSPIIQDV